jgi:hypothetical protein
MSAHVKNLNRVFTSFDEKRGFEGMIAGQWEKICTIHVLFVRVVDNVRLYQRILIISVEEMDI